MSFDARFGISFHCRSCTLRSTERKFFVSVRFSFGHFGGGDSSKYIRLGSNCFMINFCCSLGATQRYLGRFFLIDVFLLNCPPRSHRFCQSNYLSRVHCCGQHSLRFVMEAKTIPSQYLLTQMRVENTSSSLPSKSNPVERMAVEVGVPEEPLVLQWYPKFPLIDWVVVVPTRVTLFLK